MTQYTDHIENTCSYSIEKQSHDKFASLQSRAAAVTPDGAAAARRLYTPRWRWSAPSSRPPPVLGGAPQRHPLDILGVLDPPPTAASACCTLPDGLHRATERATRAFGAPPLAVLLTIIIAHQAALTAALEASPYAAPIRIGLFGPGAAAVRRAAAAIQPEAAQYLVDLFAVRGAIDDPNLDPLPRDVWPVLCPAYLPVRPTEALIPMPRPKVRVHRPHNISQLAGLAVNPDIGGYRRVLASICADDAEATYLPPDARRRATALPFLMDRLNTALSVLVTLDCAHAPIRQSETIVSARVSIEIAESAFELAMISRAHLIAFYARVRPAPTGSIHRAAAAMLRHRPSLVSPTTLTSGIGGQDLRILETAGWLEPRDEEAVHGLANRFTPSDAFLRLDLPKLPKKRASRPCPVNVLCDGTF